MVLLATQTASLKACFRSMLLQASCGMHEDACLVTPRKHLQSCQPSCICCHGSVQSRHHTAPCDTVSLTG